MYSKNQISVMKGRVVEGACRRKYNRIKETFGNDVYVIILIVVMVSWSCTY